MVNTDAGRIKGRRVRETADEFCRAVPKIPAVRNREGVEERSNGWYSRLARCQRRHGRRRRVGQPQPQSFIREENEGPPSPKRGRYRGPPSTPPKLFCRSAGFARDLALLNQSVASKASFRKYSKTVPLNLFVPGRVIIET